MKKLMVMTISGFLLGGNAVVGATSAVAADANDRIYWTSNNGALRDSAGSCVRAAEWRSGTQIKGCDKIIEKPMPVAVVLDADGDGVPDSKDRCANTPRGVRVAANGCELDSDNDGVADSKDQCAGTPAGTQVNAQGCILVVKQPITYDLRVKFANNSSKIDRQYGADFQRVADLLANDPGVRVVINGHTDSSGEADYNQWLSQRRAEAVVATLVKEYGVEAARLRAVGHGETQPIADNRTREGRRENRRVEASVKVMVAKSAN